MPSRLAHQRPLRPEPQPRPTNRPGRSWLVDVGRAALLLAGLGSIGMPVSTVASDTTPPTAQASSTDCPAVTLAYHQLLNLQARREQFRLANQLQVILLPDDEAQTVAVSISVPVGARDERAGENGYAHLFEHLMFKASATLPEGAWPQAVSRLGGSFNAETDFDRTSYYVTTPAPALARLLWLEAQRFQTPLLTEAAVHNQVQAVLEEMALRVDNVPFMRSGSEWLLQQLRGTDYDHLVLGDAATLQAATPQSLTAFYQRHYRPERMTLVIAGRLDPAAVRAQLQRDWGNWRVAGDAPLPTPVAQPLPLALQAELIDDRSPWPALALAWLTVPDDHPDAAAIALLQNHLLSGEQALLRQQLLAEQKILQQLQLPLELPKLGLVHVVLVPRAGSSLDSLQRAAEQLFADMASAPPTAATVCELKTTALRRLLSISESPLLHAYRESLDNVRWQRSRLTDEMQAIAAVTPADMARVSQHYFQHHTIALQLLPPWYVRWAKQVLEWLPISWSQSLEASVL